MPADIKEGSPSTATEGSGRRELEALNADLERLVLQFHSVTELVRRTGALGDRNRILEEIVRGIHDELAFERVAAWKWDPASNSFLGVHGVGVSPRLVQGLKVALDPVLPLVASAINDGRSAESLLPGTEKLAKEIYASLAEEPADCLLVPIQSRGQNRCFRIRSEPEGCPKAEAGPTAGLEVRMEGEQIRSVCLGCPVFPVAGFLWADRGQSGEPLGEDMLPLWFYLSQADLLLEAATLYEELSDAARRDSLTGAYNRSHFFRTLELESDRARRYGHKTCVVMIDLDDFARVNERHGQTIGDRVLEQVAECFRETLRRVDLLARYGSDEFGILLPHSDAERARMTVERLRKELSSTDLGLPGGRRSLTFSAGIAVAPGDAPDADALVGLADYAVYRAKQAGKGRTVVFGEEP